MPWIECFKTGWHTDMAGNQRFWGDEDLERIAATYNDQYPEHEAPLVLGHPETDSPAFGWVRRMKHEGQKLLADVTNLAESLVQSAREGRYRHVSIALFPDMLLRHIGLLGATPPAVKGLAPVQFRDGNDEFTEYRMERTMNIMKRKKTGPEVPEVPETPEVPDPYQEPDAPAEDKADAYATDPAEAEMATNLAEMATNLNELTERLETLMAENDGLRVKLAVGEFAADLDGMIRDGKVLPAERNDLIQEFGDLHRADGTLQFSDPAQSMVNRFRTRLARRPVVVKPRTQQFATAHRAADTAPKDKNAELDAQANQFMTDHPGTTYESAVRAVLQGGN